MKGIIVALTLTFGAFLTSAQSFDDGDIMVKTCDSAITIQWESTKPQVITQAHRSGLVFMETEKQNNMEHIQFRDNGMVRMLSLVNNVMASHTCMRVFGTAAEAERVASRNLMYFISKATHIEYPDPDDPTTIVIECGGEEYKVIVVINEKRTLRVQVMNMTAIRRAAMSRR